MEAKHWALMVAEMRRFPQVSYKPDIIVLSRQSCQSQFPAKKSHVVFKKIFQAAYVLFFP